MPINTFILDDQLIWFTLIAFLYMQIMMKLIWGGTELAMPECVLKWMPQRCWLLILLKLPYFLCASWDQLHRTQSILGEIVKETIHVRHRPVSILSHQSCCARVEKRKNKTLLFTLSTGLNPSTTRIRKHLTTNATKGASIKSLLDCVN